MTAPVREWVTFQDPNRKKHIWHVDVTFLTSNYLCIFGQGCQGVLTEKAPEQSEGCCSYGAHSSGPKDRKLVDKVAAKLTADDWQCVVAEENLVKLARRAPDWVHGVESR